MGRSSGIIAGLAIAKQMKMPPKYILKILSRLRTANLIGSIPGSQGGYYLMKPLEEIALQEILYIMEPASKVPRHPEGEENGGRGTAHSYPVHLCYQEMQDELETKWLSRNLLEIQERFAKS